MTTPHGGFSRLKPKTIERDRHLVADGGPKRVLSLDGGGVRGLVTIGILTALETRLAKRQPYPDDFRLCHYFDLIGGTSTGAIIAALLAMGKRMSEIEEIYLKLAPRVFGQAVSLGFHEPKFSYTVLQEIIAELIGDMELQSEQLKTGFALFTKRVDTASAWVLSNHPDSRYWDSETGNFLPNKQYEVGKLVRASAAAPYYFDAQRIVICDTRGGKFERDVGIFLDGAVGGANNPSVQLLTLATHGDYPFQWSTGANKLFVVSIGTGTRRERILAEAYNEQVWGGNVRKAVASLQGMIADTSLYAIMTMQALSVPPPGSKRWFVNSELGDMASGPIANPPICTYLRLDASLEKDHVAPIIGGEFSSDAKLSKAVKALGAIDNGDPKNLARLLKVGLSAGSKVGEAELPPMFDIPLRAPGS